MLEAHWILCGSAGAPRVDVHEARAVLGVSPGATRKEVKAAYRRLALECHPDRGSTDEGRRFRTVGEAYELLRDAAAEPVGGGGGGEGPFNGAWAGDHSHDAPDAKPNPNHQEYGLAIGATTMEDLDPARHFGSIFWGRKPIEVESIGRQPDRGDATCACHNLMRIEAQKNADRTGRVHVLSAGLLIRDDEGSWMWATRLEVTVHPRLRTRAAMSNGRRRRRRC